jgi:hypothetical protein
MLTTRFVAVTLAALALTMTSAHVLEMPQKMTYGPELYTAVNTTMYKYFAIVGGSYQIGAIAAAGLLVFLTRKHRPAFGWTLTGALFLLLSFASWLLIVAPVNNEIADALEGAPETVPALWMEMRARWEYGHAAGFVLQLLGFAALVVSLLVDTHKTSPTAS